MTADLKISAPFTLKCGLTLRNRLAKAAMAEQMSKNGTVPNELFEAVYGGWAEGGWGMVITGNVHVDARYLGGPKDVSTDQSAGKEQQLEAWRAWAEASKRNGTPTIVQINHPGRQSPTGAGKRSLFAKNLAPSAVPLRLGDGIIAKIASSLVFGTPKAMTVGDIEEIVQNFAKTAALAAESGFAGVQVHAAHGYLLAQFLSEKANLRTDEYGGSPSARAKIVVDIVRAIRAVVPATFCVGIKLNSVDHQSASALKNCTEQLRAIVEPGVDFLEISGGSYENPTMYLGVPDESKTDRTMAREAFFLDFAKAIRQDFPNVPLMVTGGFRTRQGMEAAVADGACDFVGLGRPAVLNPSLPNNIIFNREIQDEDARVYAKKVEIPWIVEKIKIKPLGVGVESSWYVKQMQNMAVGRSKA